MPLFNPPEMSSANGIAVDSEGFVTFPNDPQAVPFKVTRDETVPERFLVAVKDGVTEKVIYNAEP